MSAQQLNLPLLKSRLRVKSVLSKANLLQNHPYVVHLLAPIAVAGALLFAPVHPTSPPNLSLPGNNLAMVSPFDLHQTLAQKLQETLPSEVAPLTEIQEQAISKTLHETFGIHAGAVLEGERLNRSYGLIGAEQHLVRYPGDVLGNHQNNLNEGMAPGRGAWGYFAWSREQLTQDLIEKEKYYFAVQTLYLPDWQTRLPFLRDWYKYRKMLAVNPVNGKVIVGVVGDAGPAMWTGKHFGGSPEIMAYLGLNVGKQKGPVVMFFVDDPRDQIPLGPIEYNLEKGRPLLG